MFGAYKSFGLGRKPQAFNFGMVGKTSKACLAENGMFYHVHVYLNKGVRIAHIYHTQLTQKCISQTKTSKIFSELNILCISNSINSCPNRAFWIDLLINIDSKVMTDEEIPFTQVRSEEFKMAKDFKMLEVAIFSLCHFMF